MAGNKRGEGDSTLSRISPISLSVHRYQFCRQLARAPPARQNVLISIAHCRRRGVRRAFLSFPPLHPIFLSNPFELFRRDRINFAERNSLFLFSSSPRKRKGGFEFWRIPAYPREEKGWRNREYSKERSLGWGRVTLEESRFIQATGQTFNDRDSIVTRYCRSSPLH